MASGDTIRLTSTRSVGDSEGEAAVGSYKRTIERQAPKSRKKTDTQIKKPNEMDSMQGNLH